jgi:hypothetical protein
LNVIIILREGNKMKKLLVLLCSIALIFGVGTSAYALSFSGPGSDYQVLAFTGDWDAARAAALALGPGWDLAGISSEAEQLLIAGQLNSFLGLPADPSTVNPDFTNLVWVGGMQASGGAEPLGDWGWVNGEDFSAYQNWANSAIPEPNDTGGSGAEEDYLALDYRHMTGSWIPGGELVRDWDWNDNVNSGDFIVAYVAERSIPEPTTLLLLGTGLIGLAGLSRKKFFK